MGAHDQGSMLYTASSAPLGSHFVEVQIWTHPHIIGQQTCSSRLYPYRLLCFTTDVFACR